MYTVSLYTVSLYTEPVRERNFGTASCIEIRNILVIDLSMSLLKHQKKMNELQLYTCILLERTSIIYLYSTRTNFNYICVFH